MILFLLLIIFNSVCCITFNNSILTVPPWDLINCSTERSCVNLKDQYEKSCAYSCPNGTCSINIGIILPNSTDYIVNANEAKNALDEAVLYGKTKRIINDNINITTLIYDDKCETDQASYKIIQSTKNPVCSHIVFGLICDYCLASAGRIHKYFGYGGVPIITSGGFTYDFVDKKNNFSDQFYLVYNSGPADYRSFAEFFHLILNAYHSITVGYDTMNRKTPLGSYIYEKLFSSYGWKKIALMYERDAQKYLAGNNNCQLFFETVVQEIKHTPQFDFVDGDLRILKMDYLTYLTSKVGVNYGIILTCTNSTNLREFILTAESLKMWESGEYTVFNFELFNDAPDPSRPWYKHGDSEERNIAAKKAYQSVFTFSPHLETNFTRVNNTPRGSIYIDGLYDGMLMYLEALNQSLVSLNGSLSEDQDVLGCEIGEKMMGAEFHQGKSDVIMNCNGQRSSSYALLNVDANGEYQVVASYTTTNKTILHWNVTWPFGIPEDTPKCGYDNSKCPVVDAVNVLLLSLVSVTTLGLLIVGCIMYRHIKLRRKINANAWKVDYKDIVHFPSKPRASFSSRLDDADSMCGADQKFVEMAYYKNIRVAVRRLNSSLNFNRKEIIQLTGMKDITNDNLVKFYGVCIDPQQPCILTEYCPRGGLTDVLEKTELKLDWSFKMSFIMDLVRGMNHLHHNTQLKLHGSLKSSNCLVDGRLTLKISNFGLQFLRPNMVRDDEDEESYQYWAKQFWTAPELLRNPGSTGTQKGDVYSFGIIMHEIISRHVGFYLGEDDFMDVKNIIEIVRKGPEANNGEPLRPLIDSVLEDGVQDIMKSCVSEDPDMRPDFSSLKTRLRQLNGGNTDRGVLDNLLNRMEQYANNLEVLVDERTADYLEQKRKCEELLYQLLPKSVAELLISGQPVIAEAFDQVTIYFSDIVGFTSLSAESTALEVVHFLNDLYTCFDSIIESFDVYKVETIGDAYMVVSGLPKKNGNDHAREIARMSLALLEAVRMFEIRHKPGMPLRLRIGIHSGPCVAGVVGLKMPRYCLFGDTVNTASRMESTGLPLRIHVSPATKAVLDTFKTFLLEPRGAVEVKGKGTMVTYWLNGEKNDIPKKEIKQEKEKLDSLSPVLYSSACDLTSIQRRNSKKGSQQDIQLRVINEEKVKEADAMPLLSVTSLDY